MPESRNPMENNRQIPTPGRKYQLVLPMGHQRDLNQTVNSVEAEKSMIGNNTINQEPDDISSGLTVRVF